MSRQFRQLQYSSGFAYLSDVQQALLDDLPASDTMQTRLP
jgi:hypothetical protein